jgi:hypothetical protein
VQGVSRCKPGLAELNAPSTDPQIRRDCLLNPSRGATRQLVQCTDVGGVRKLGGERS